jgi:hypothetical protein
MQDNTIHAPAGRFVSRTSYIHIIHSVNLSIRLITDDTYRNPQIENLDD